MKMEKTYEVELIEDIPENIPLVKKGIITAKEEWYGHSFGDCVGRIYDDGEKVSFFSDDQNNGTTELFDTLRSKGMTQAKHRHVINWDTDMQSI